VKARRASIAVAASSLLLLGVATPAGADTMLAIGAQGKLLDRGMALAVPIRYECPPEAAADPSPWLNVGVTQAVPGNHKGRVPMSSYDLRDAVCDGSPHAATMHLRQDDYELPFRSGVALATGSLIYTDAGGVYHVFTVSRDIRLSPRSNL
jgi:hypothetical protein